MFSLPEKFTSAEIIPLALFTSTILYTFLSVYSWRKRPALTATPFTWLMLAMAWWSFGYGLEIVTPSLPDKVFWAKLQYPGIVAIPILWFEFALEYTRREAFLTRRNQTLLWLMPIIIVALVWTNELHQWIWTVTRLEPINHLTVLHLEHGAAFWVSVTYNYVLIVSGSWLLITGAWQNSQIYRSQAIVIMVAVLIPLLGNIIYLTGLLPDIGVDLTIFFFIPMSLVLAWGIARYRLLSIIPPEQAAILRNLRDGVLVVDAQHQLIYMNHSAEEIFARKADASLGQPLDLICASCQAQIQPLLGEAEKMLELTLDVKGQSRKFEIHISFVQSLNQSSSRSEQRLYLIVFHDITTQKKTESALIRREAILKAVGTASEYFLKTSTWEQYIPAVLEQIGRAAAVSRIYIFEHHMLENETMVASQRYEWADGYTPSQIYNPSLQNIPLQQSGYARWKEAFEQHRIIFGLVRQFPELEREALSTQGIQSIAVVPIFTDENIWGFIGFDECKYEREWDQAELDALRTAADIFGAALVKSNSQKHLLKRQRTLNLLQEILHSSLSQDSLPEMAQFLVDHLGILIEADGCFLTLWDEDKKQVTPLAAYGEYRDAYRTMSPRPDERSFTASVLEVGHTLVIDSVMDSSYISKRIAEQFPTASALVVPMISNERKLGAVMLGFNNQHHFSLDEIAVCEQAANLVALAIAKFQAVEQADRRANESETLRKAGAVVAETLDPTEATQRILQQLAHVLPHDSASVQLLRDSHLEIVGEHGFKTSVMGIRFPIPGDNPNTRVIQTRQPHLLHDAKELYPAFRQPPHDHIRSWLGVPLIVRDQTIGLLAIDSKEPSHFSSSDIELMIAFADQVAVVMEHARLFNEIQRLAITDGLTGLYNRRHFMEVAQKEFDRARRYKRYLSTMIFDIDHFKTINDTHGHQAGDTTLRAIANLCREKIREVDPLARYGGEEFIGLFIETNMNTARQVAERLRADVANMNIETGKGTLQATISIGLAEQTYDTPDVTTLINRADQALYIAKYKGRNRVAVSE